MTEFKVNGLVIFDREIGENDKLLTILCEKYGKIFVIAKGVRSIKNRNMCCSHIFTYASFVIRKKGSYYYLVDSDLLENFFSVRNDILKLSLASYFCDVISHIAQEGVCEDELLRLTLNSIYALSTDKHEIEHVRCGFQLRVVAEIGMAPDVHSCSVCNKIENISGYLDLIDGIIVCDDCRNKLNFQIEENPFTERGLQKPIALVNPSIIKSIEYITSSDIKIFLSFTITNDNCKLLFDLSEKFLINQLERTFYSLEFYKSLL
jgi:DNA repair protein RecO (recombination protein O)